MFRVVRVVFISLNSMLFSMIRLILMFIVKGVKFSSVKMMVRFVSVFIIMLFVLMWCSSILVSLVLFRLSKMF